MAVAVIVFGVARFGSGRDSWCIALFPCAVAVAHFLALACALSYLDLAGGSDVESVVDLAITIIVFAVATLDAGELLAFACRFPYVVDADLDTCLAGRVLLCVGWAGVTGTCIACFAISFWENATTIAIFAGKVVAFFVFFAFESFKGGDGITGEHAETKKHQKREEGTLHYLLLPVCCDAQV